MSHQSKKTKTIRHCLGRVEECVLTTLCGLPDGTYIADINRTINEKLANLNITVSHMAFYKAVMTLETKGFVTSKKVIIEKYDRTICKYVITDLGIEALKEIYCLHRHIWDEEVKDQIKWLMCDREPGE